MGNPNTHYDVQYEDNEFDDNNGEELEKNKYSCLCCNMESGPLIGGILIYMIAFLNFIILYGHNLGEGVLARLMVGLLRNDSALIMWLIGFQAGTIGVLTVTIKNPRGRIQMGYVFFAFSLIFACVVVYHGIMGAEDVYIGQIMQDVSKHAAKYAKDKMGHDAHKEFYGLGIEKIVNAGILFLIWVSSFSFQSLVISEHCLHAG
jgi:hypothetical protein